MSNFTIYTANSKYAEYMYYGMHDVIDISTLAQTLNKTPYDAFDEIMDFKLLSTDATVDMRAKTFVAPIRTGGYWSDSSHGMYLLRYVRIVVEEAPSRVSYYYAFVTSRSEINSDSSLCHFEIDWWHTLVINLEAGKKLALGEGYVARSNAQKLTIGVKSETDTSVVWKKLDCGKGREDVVPYEMLTLESELPYENALANFSTFSDRDIRWIRFTFSQSNVAPEIFSGGLYTQRDELGTGLVYAFLPLIPRGTYKYVRQVLSGATIGYNYDEYLDYTNALTRSLTLAPTCVSVELIPSAPFISKVDSLRTTEGNLGIEITYDNNVVRALNPTIESLKDKIWLIQTGMDATHILPKQSTYKIGVTSESRNSPSFTRFFSGTSLSYYSPQNLRRLYPIEPKLGQPQYSKTVITDNCGGSFTIDPSETNGDIEEIQVIADYTGSTFKRKWYVSDGENAYMHDYKGRRFFAVNDKMNGYPLVNDAYIDYMNGRRNQIINGLAVTKATAVTNLVSGAVQGAMGASIGILGGGQPVSAIGNYTSSLAKNATNAIDSILTAQWNHEAQMADLNEQANSVEAAKGNNAEFDVIEGNGAIVRQVWRCSEKDTRRLVEYFHRYGYAVGEMQNNIKLNTMYYFDYLQVSDIKFVTDYQSLPTNYQFFGAFRGNGAEEYIRKLFANGIRIWHGRKEATNGTPQLFSTAYLNTTTDSTTVVA